MSETIMENTEATGAPQENQEQAVKTYTQEEFDRHMAGMRKSIESKFEKQFAELGDLNELKQLKIQAEKQRQEEALKKGEFEKVLQEMAAKKDAEIQKRDAVIEDYKVNAPLLSAAAKYKAIAPEQVQNLLRQSVRLGSEGEAEVLDANGLVRYDDTGKPLTVDALVKEFLDTNKHFVAAAPSTTNTKSNVGLSSSQTDFNLSDLDLSKPAHRQLYKEARAKGLV